MAIFTTIKNQVGDISFHQDGNLYVGYAGNNIIKKNYKMNGK